MTTFSHITHHMGKLDNGMYAVKRVTPIVRLGSSSESVYLQQGNFYDASGVVLEPESLPGWVGIEMRKMSPAALKDVGFEEVPSTLSGKLQTSQSQSLVAEWQCPECGKMMDERNKEPHLAKHARHKDVKAVEPKKE